MCLIDGIVSVGSFETLIQWLYRAKATFPEDLTATEEITKVVEFARLCDMVQVTGMEEVLAQHIKILLQETPVAAKPAEGESGSPFQSQKNGAECTGEIWWILVRTRDLIPPPFSATEIRNHGRYCVEIGSKRPERQPLISPPLL
jgi:hypothetical protein